MPNSKTAPNKYAKSSWGQSNLIDLEVPSGQLCQVRRPGVQGLVAAGVLDRMDSLTAIVDKKHVKKGKNSSEVDTASLLADPKALMDVVEVMDKVVCYVVTQPKVLPTPKDEDREELPADSVYVDSIELEDKTFIFQFVVGGTRDLESFREQREAVVGNLDDGKSNELSSVGSTKN